MEPDARSAAYTPREFAVLVAWTQWSWLVVIGLVLAWVRPW